MFSYNFFPIFLVYVNNIIAHSVVKYILSEKFCLISLKKYLKGRLSQFIMGTLYIIYLSMTKKKKYACAVLSQEFWKLYTYSWLMLQT